MRGIDIQSKDEGKRAILLNYLLLRRSFSLDISLLRNSKFGTLALG